MREFDGDLLIGGERLRQLHGQLDQEEKQSLSKDWLLAGRVTVNLPEHEWLQPGREFRLMLDDGRAGQIRVSNVAEQDGAGVVLEFEPIPARRKAKAK